MNTEMHSSSSNDWWWKGQLFSRPRRAPRMVGREGHKKQIRSFLESDATTALHIVGIGGVGKTWLARWLAWQGHDVGRPLAWIECSQKAVTVESLVDSIAAATENRGISRLQEHLEAQPAVGESDPLAGALDECTDVLDRLRCILVLDDFHDLSERVATALQYRFLSHVIQGLQQARLVVVSRRTPAIWDDPKLRPFQERIRLQGFTEEETKAFLVSRAIGLRPELMEQLRHKAAYGVPMALELLAARLQGVSSDDELVRIIQDTPIYRVSGVGEWLDAQVQDLRRRAYRFLVAMSILRRPEETRFCEKLWQIVAPGKDFQSRLEAVESLSLLEVMDSEISVIDLFREYIVEERLTDAQRSQLHDQASLVYLEEAAHLADSDRQKDCLVECVWHASQSSNFERVLEAAETIERLDGIEDDFALLAQVDEQIFEAARAVQDHESQMDWSCLLGNRLRLSGDVTEASSVLREGYAIAESQGSNEDEFRVLRLLAGTLHAQGDYDRARELYERCLILAESMEDPDRQLAAHVELASTQLRTNQIVQAEEGLRFSAQLALELGNRDIEAKARCKLGRLYLKHKRDPSAQDHAREILHDALDGFRDTGNLSGQAEANSLLGDFYRYREERSLALKYYRGARQVDQRLGHRAKEAITIGRMAFLERDRGNYEEAFRLSDESLHLSERLGNPKGKQIQLILGAELLLRLGHPERARQRIEEALRMCRGPIPDRIGEASAYRALAKYYQHEGDHGAAKDSIERAVLGYVETESFQYAKETWQVLQRIYTDWASDSDVNVVSRELGLVAGDSTEVYHEARSLLLAHLLVAKLPEAEEPSRHLSEMIEQLIAADIPRQEWGDEVVQLCIEEWPRLSADVIEGALYWLEPVSKRTDLYEAWIAAAIHDKDTTCFETIVEKVQEQEFSFQDEFALLEPLEPELVGEPDLERVRKRLAQVYENGLTKENARCIRERRSLPPYARDARRGLRYLDPERFDHLKTEVIPSELRAARADDVVGEDFDPIPAEESDPDLRDKRVVLIGGYPKVRHWAVREASERFSLELVDVPPAWERQVSQKRMSEVVDGADLIVKVPGCMKHQGKNCLDAVGLDLPVVDAAGTGKSSIIRAITDYFAEASTA